MKSAEKLQSDVVDELAFDPKVDSSGIAVTATPRGIVTLKGAVRQYSEKRAADEAVKRVGGVKGVANDIDVRPEAEPAFDDTAIAEAAVQALKWCSVIPENTVKVSVSEGWLTLVGEVAWEFRRTAAHNAVRDLRGVRGVTNKIVVTPSASAADVKQKIEAAFRRSAQIDADHVTVGTDGGKVTLRGTVSSWSEFEEAEDAAWAAAGVTHVDNLLEVEDSSVYA
jgi:osmotically-inducible protein OsmY